MPIPRQWRADLRAVIARLSIRGRVKPAALGNKGEGRLRSLFRPFHFVLSFFNPVLISIDRDSFFFILTWSKIYEYRYFSSNIHFFLRVNYALIDLCRNLLDGLKRDLYSGFVYTRTMTLFFSPFSRSPLPFPNRTIFSFTLPPGGNDHGDFVFRCACN